MNEEEYCLRDELLEILDELLEIDWDEYEYTFLSNIQYIIENEELSEESLLYFLNILCNYFNVEFYEDDGSELEESNGFYDLFFEINRKTVGKLKMRFRGGKPKRVKLGFRGGKRIKQSTLRKLKIARKRNKAKMKRIMRNPGRVAKAKRKRSITDRKFFSRIERQKKITKSWKK